MTQCGPLDPQSDALINSLAALGPSSGLRPPPYGIPYVGVGGSEPRVPVTFVEYGEESDNGFSAERGYPIPEAAETQPHFIEGGRPGGGSDGDRHLLIVDRDRWLLYELFAARWTGQRWEAGSGAVFDLSSNTRRPEGWTSADAGGLAILPGLVRTTKRSAGRSACTARHRQSHQWYVWPASHRAGRHQRCAAMGARLRLKLRRDLSRYPTYIRTFFAGCRPTG